MDIYIIEATVDNLSGHTTTKQVENFYKRKLKVVRNFDYFMEDTPILIIEFLYAQPTYELRD